MPKLHNVKWSSCYYCKVTNETMLIFFSVVQSSQAINCETKIKHMLVKTILALLKTFDLGKFIVKIFRVKIQNIVLYTKNCFITPSFFICDILVPVHFQNHQSIMFKEVNFSTQQPSSFFRANEFLSVILAEVLQTNKV